MTLSSSLAMYSVMRDIPDARKVHMERGWVALHLYATCKFSNLLSLETMGLWIWITFILIRTVQLGYNSTPYEAHLKKRGLLALVKKEKNAVKSQKGHFVKNYLLCSLSELHERQPIFKTFNNYPKMVRNAFNVTTSVTTGFSLWLTSKPGRRGNFCDFWRKKNPFAISLHFLLFDTFKPFIWNVQYSLSVSKY